MISWLSNYLPRTDRIWVPDMPGPYDMIVCFHGWKVPPRVFRRNSRLDQLGQWFTESGRPTIVYYPAAHWGNWGLGPDPWREPREAVDYADRKVFKVILKYAMLLSPRRYCVGFSKGALFAGYYARYGDFHPHAVVMYAGSHVGERPAGKQYSVLTIRGTEDKLVSREKWDLARQWYTAQGHRVEVLEPEGSGHQWDVSVNRAVFEFLKGAS